MIEWVKSLCVISYPKVMLFCYKVYLLLNIKAGFRLFLLGVWQPRAKSCWFTFENRSVDIKNPPSKTFLV